VKRFLVALSIGTALVTLALTLPRPGAGAVPPCPEPTIVVHKAKGEVILSCRGEERRRFPATFGAQPVGPKEREGDERTPEGKYRVSSRVKTARFHRFLGISYPNDEDRKRANDKGIARPGGGIGIHGTSERLAPAGRAWTRLAHALGLQTLWGPTDGCIALDNADVEALYDVAQVGTAVEITP
jgi:murein L,D-transpeptidase YafK